MRSDIVKQGFQRAPHRGLLQACGLSDADINKPFIGVANSFCEIVPGHVHLNKVAEIVKAGHSRCGRRALRVQYHRGLRWHRHGPQRHEYSLASREIIADAVETMVRAHCFDGLVCIPNCDKIVPGMLMASVRLNIPTIFVSGGPMEAGKARRRAVDLISVFEGVGEFKRAR